MANRNEWRLAATWTLGCIVCAAAPAHAEPPLREARSANGQYELRIEPGRAARGEYRRARAALTTATEEGQRIWRAQLVNEGAPAQAFVRDDARYVVTLDEYRRGGAAHAVAIYDERGKLKRELKLRELLRRNDWEEVHSRGRAIEWLEDAKADFADGDLFVIRLRWGRELRIDLEAADVLTGHEADSAAEGEIPIEFAALLHASDEESDAARIPDFTPELLRALAELISEVGVPLDDLWGLIEEAADMVAREDDAFELDESVANWMDEGLVIEDDAAMVAEIAPPAPNPADPVDYLAWLNQFVTPADSPSLALVEQAVAASVNAELDGELLGRSLEGDPAALADPSVQEWLSANQTGIELFRQLAQTDYRGARLKVNDGELAVEALLPSLAPLRNLARATLVQARVREAAGDIEGAMSDYLATMRVGGQAGAGGTLIENLVGVAVQAMTSQTLLDSFAGPHADEIDYAQLAPQLDASFGAIRPSAETMLFEQAAVLDVIQRVYMPDPATGSYKISSAGLEKAAQFMGGEHMQTFQLGAALQAAGFEHVQQEIRDYYGSMASAARLPYAEAMQQLGQLEEGIADPRVREANPILGAFVPSLARAVTLKTRGLATQRATSLVTRIKAYRQQHGVYPDSLETVGSGEQMIDPFSGAPFRYQSDGADFSLYSVGGNLIDDAGTHSPSVDEGDTVYWPRPPRK